MSKKNIEPHQSFTGSYKKHRGSGLTPIHTEYQKLKKVNSCGKNCQNNTILNLKTMFISEKKKHIIISEMS